MIKGLLCVATLFIVIVIGNITIVAQDRKPPIAKKVPKILKIHGYEITDNYAWMRDRNKEKDPAIIEYLTAENKYTESFMGKHQPLVDTLYKEMLGRIKQTDLNVPVPDQGYVYYSRTEKGKQWDVQQPVYLPATTLHSLKTVPRRQDSDTS